MLILCNHWPQGRLHLQKAADYLHCSYCVMAPVKGRWMSSISAFSLAPVLTPERHSNTATPDLAKSAKRGKQDFIRCYRNSLTLMNTQTAWLESRRRLANKKLTQEILRFVTH